MFAYQYYQEHLELILPLDLIKREENTERAVALEMRQYVAQPMQLAIAAVVDTDAGSEISYEMLDRGEIRGIEKKDGEMPIKDTIPESDRPDGAGGLERIFTAAPVREYIHSSGSESRNHQGLSGL